MSPSVTVTTDRGWYLPGEQVTIQISASGFPTNESLWMYLDGPDERNVYFTDLPANGTTILWNIPADALDGTYTVTVMWDHRYVETAFTVTAQPVPELPFPRIPLVLLLAITFASCALFRWKASTRA